MLSRRLIDIPHTVSALTQKNQWITNLQMSTEGLCLITHVTHPGGFVQQELEGVVRGLWGLELGATQLHQVVFDMLVDPAIQGLEDREREREQDPGLQWWMD